MTRRATLFGALLCAACAGALPPPGAPAASAPLPAARGYEAVTPQGVELEFDNARQTYQVRRAPGTYWLDGRFFRRSSAGWETSPRLEGPWQACAASDLPGGLR